MVVNSLIGENTVLRGEFDLEGVLRIDGTFYGKVDGNGKVLIGEGGNAHSDIKARVVVIGGTVYGDVIASEMITILSTGKLIGNIQTPRLLAEEGMIFEGKCVISDKKKFEQKTSAQNKKDLREARSALKLEPAGKELVKQ